jgi:hypothetical protein
VIADKRLVANAGAPWRAPTEIMTLREQLQERERQWKLFHEWEAQNPPKARPLEAVMADLSSIWRRLPEDVRSTDPDPQKLGLRRLREIIDKIEAGR